MEFQFHLASPRATVRTLPLSKAGQRVLVVLCALLALLATSLWFTVPAAFRRRLRQEGVPRLEQEIATERSEREEVAGLGRALKTKALDLGDLLNRIAFLYEIPVAAWPRALNPERRTLSSDDPERVAAGVELYLRGMEKAEDLIEQRENADPDLARRVPAIFPFAGALFEPSAFFGPRISPWTGAEEFFPGVDLAAPGGSAVVASGGGTVVFAGTLRRSATDWFWRLGNVVVISHGEQGATLYGHLARIEVRRGARVTRRQRVGIVGATGWAISPQLHYEYWRRSGPGYRPTDPLFAGLDRRTGQPLLSLEQMKAASAPGPLDPLPGIEISGDRVGAPERPSLPAPGRLKKRPL
jgi:murein DD-endopeptidase MepM/ murein hydrolase activator NlpD